MSKKTNKTLLRGSSGSSSSFWLCIALLVLCGCSTAENETTEQGKSVPIGVQASLAGSKNQLDTRVSTGLITAEGAKMDVFLTNQNGYKPVYNKEYTYLSGAWTNTDPIYIDKRAAKLVAYYDPNNTQPFPDSPTTVSKPDALIVQKFDDTKIWYYDSTQPDLMYTNPNITFQLKPAYARLKVSVLRTASYLDKQGPCKIDRVGLATDGANAYTQRALDLSTGIPEGTLTPAPRLDPGINAIAINETNTTGCDFLLPPQDITAPGVTLYMKVDNEERTLLIPASYIPEQKLKSGSQYNISVQIVGVATLVLNGPIQVDDGGWSTLPTEADDSFDEAQPE